MVWDTACPTNVSTVHPRAVRRQAVVVWGIGTVARALPSAPVTTAGSHRPSPLTSRRGGSAGLPATAGLSAPALRSVNSDAEVAGALAAASS